VSGLTRNALSQLTEIQRYSNLAGTNLVADTTYGYDNDSRLTTLSNALGSTGSTVLNNSMSYDADSQLTTLTTPDGTSTLTYDHDGQLTSASLTSEAYTYDANGNRTGTGITTDANNEVQTEGAYDYAYDANGNLITQTTIATGATENFTWDYRNRLTGIVYKNSSGTVTGSISYTYDPLTNNRISMTQEDGSGTVIAQEYYVYDGANLLMVLDGSGNLTERYLTGNGANQVLAAETGISGSSAGTTSWDLTDYQGSTTDVISNIAYTYDPLTGTSDIPPAVKVNTRWTRIGRGTASIASDTAIIELPIDANIHSAKPMKFTHRQAMAATGLLRRENRDSVEIMSPRSSVG
jgi:YD repeat-containing protein